jgi:hypothetical protein
VGVQYVCDDQERRLESVRARADLNGIDFLEVLGDEAPTGIPPQRTILVRCLQPLDDGLSKANVRIEGGVRMDPRLNPVRIEWAFKATRIASAPAGDPTILPTDRTYFQSLPEPDRLLVVRTSSVGDFSTYRLVLARTAVDDSPPAGFDTQLCEVSFSFKVDCPADFDCRTEHECPPKLTPAPQIDYLTKDYASFRGLILDRLALIMPDWKERNPADLEIALVEVLAYVGDQLSYYQDAVATEAYLGTARRRVSVRRYARLLDYFMHDGCNARAWIAIDVDRNGGADGATFDAPTMILSRDRGDGATVRPATLDEALASNPVVFETLHPIQTLWRRNRIQFHTWGDLRCCLPAGATRATLRGKPDQLKLRAGDVLLFEEILGPSGKAVDADPDHCQAVRLDGDPVPGTDQLDGTSVLEIAWHQEDALQFPLCLWQFAEGSGVTGASVARGNVVLADHGMSVPKPEVLAMVPLGDTVPYRPRLQRPGLTFRMPYVDQLARKRPAAEAIASDPQQAVPQITLDDGPDTWSPRRDLLATNRFLPEFVVEMESDGRAYLRFGDDVLGRRPTEGSILSASYRVGGGRAGNVGPRALTRLVTDLDGIGPVRNLLPAVGGEDPEPIERVRQFAPQAFRTQQRAVTEADYAEVTQRRRSVQRAAATRRWTGSWYTEFVAIDRRGGFAVDRPFRADMASYLESFRMAGTDVEIDPPTFVPLDVVLTVCVEPDYFRSDVKADLLRRFSKGRLADGSLGFFHPDNFTFGQPVFLSRVVAAAMEIEGVSWVDTSHGAESPNRFGRWGQRPQVEFDEGIIKMARLEVAQLDNDPNATENGRIDFVMQGGR